MPSTSLRSPKPKDCSGMRTPCASGGRRETGEVRSGDGLVMTSRSEPLPSPLSSSGSGGALPIDVQCTHRVPSRLESRRRMQTVLAITAGVMIAEAIGGWLAHSLALLADAGHMLADVAAIGLSLAVAYLAQRPATAERTFGLLRLEILAALVNGALLVIVAAIGLTANAAGTAILHRGHDHSLNQRGAYLHIFSDLLGSLGALAAGVIILGSAWRLVKESADVLLEAAPAHIPLSDVHDRIASVPGVASVHDLHVWTV